MFARVEGCKCGQCNSLQSFPLLGPWCNVNARVGRGLHLQDKHIAVSLHHVQHIVTHISTHCNTHWHTLTHILIHFNMFHRRSLATCAAGQSCVTTVIPGKLQTRKGRAHHWFLNKFLLKKCPLTVVNIRRGCKHFLCRICFGTHGHVGHVHHGPSLKRNSPTMFVYL